jgi:hypothetical protein
MYLFLYLLAEVHNQELRILSKTFAMLEDTEEMQLVEVGVTLNSVA